MPALFGTIINAVTYDLLLSLDLDGAAFGINEYPGVSAVAVAPAGSTTWTPVASIDVWGDERIEATLASVLGAGDYDVRVTSSDGEVYVLSSGISVASADTVHAGRFMDVSVACCI